MIAKPVQQAVAQLGGALYGMMRPALFRTLDAQQAHERILLLLAALDINAAAIAALQTLNRASLPHQSVTVGGVTLPHPMILAAGFVKGTGFNSEQRALTAIRQREDIIPGWRSVPALLGPVEFGSYTRYPRVGNPGTVLWRDTATYSTQNRIGLKNPGAVAAAAFLSLHRRDLPPVFGINIAVSPGVNDAQQEITEVIESISAFVARGVYPSWFTLNLSCPNTEDDPSAHQTARKAETLCGAIVDLLRRAADETGREFPLWVKVGPGLSDAQYAALMQAFHATGVRAVIATNTSGQPAPDGTDSLAGVGGGRLRPQALHAARALIRERREHGYAVDVIGCGGVMDPVSYAAYTQAGVSVVQYWSALIYRGPLVAALILSDT